MFQSSISTWSNPWSNLYLSNNLWQASSSSAGSVNSTSSGGGSPSQMVSSSGSSPSQTNGSPDLHQFDYLTYGGSPDNSVNSFIHNVMSLVRADDSNACDPTRISQININGYSSIPSNASSGFGSMPSSTEGISSVPSPNRFSNVPSPSGFSDLSAGSSRIMSPIGTRPPANEQPPNLQSQQLNINKNNPHLHNNNLNKNFNHNTYNGHHHNNGFGNHHHNQRNGHHQRHSSALVLPAELPSPYLSNASSNSLYSNQNVYQNVFFCETHKETQRYFCQTCSQLICEECAHGNHRLHMVANLNDAVEAASSLAGEVLLDAKSCLAHMQEELETVNVSNL